MAPSPPFWLKTVTTLERLIGEQVEKVVRSDTYFDVVSELTRNQRRVGHALEDVSKRCLHRLNLPAGTDIRRVREQLSRMERQLAAVTKELEDLQEPDEPVRRTRAG